MLKSSILSSAPFPEGGNGKLEGDDVWGAPVGPLPSVSSRINFGEETVDVRHDLWVVGSGSQTIVLSILSFHFYSTYVMLGTLGELLVRQWKALFPTSRVVAETLTEKRHQIYSDLGVQVRLRSNRDPDDIKTAKNLVICLPPSAALKGYLEEISNATLLWAVLLN